MRQDIIDTYMHYTSGDINFLEAKFDKAILGIEQNSFKVVYSRKKIIKILTKEFGNRYEAIEYAEFNIFDAYIGQQTPIWVDDDF